MGDFGEDNEFINNTNWMVTRGRTLPPLKRGDFGDQSYSLHILSLIKTNFGYTYPTQKSVTLVTIGNL